MLNGNMRFTAELFKVAILISVASPLTEGKDEGEEFNVNGSNRLKRSLTFPLPFQRRGTSPDDTQSAILEPSTASNAGETS